MKNYFFVLGALIIFSQIHAQTAAEFIALGKNNSMLNSASQIHLNNAIMFKEKLVISAHGTNTFVGTNLQNGGIVFGTSIKNTNLGISYFYRGLAALNQNQLLLHIAKKITNSFNIGLNCGINYQVIQGLYSQKNIIYQLAFQYTITPKIQLNTIVKNAFFNKEKYENIEYNSFYFAGKYLPNEKTKLLFGFNYMPSSESSPVVGFSHVIKKNIEIIASLKNANDWLGLGCNFLLKDIQIGLGTSYHNYLGFTPAFSLIWQKK